jgi:outer membrane receptor for monomeric catechols
MGTRNITNLTDLTFQFATGSVARALVTGLELARETTHNRNSSPTTNQPQNPDFYINNSISLRLNAANLTDEEYVDRRSSIATPAGSRSACTSTTPYDRFAIRRIASARTSRRRCFSPSPTNTMAANWSSTTRTDRTP